jgi:hypothetical protein
MNSIVWESTSSKDGLIVAANAANALKISSLDTRTLRSVWTLAKKSPGGAAGKEVMNRLEFNMACKLAVMGWILWSGENAAVMFYTCFLEVPF